MIVKQLTRGIMILCVSIPSIFLSSDARCSAQDVDSFNSWAVEEISAWAPPGRTFIPEAKETKDEATARYSEIVNDAMTVAFDPSEKPLFNGKYGRSMTLAIILSVAWWESGFRKDVDYNLGNHSRGDGGKSWCLMQLELGQPHRKDPNNTNLHIVLKENGGFELTRDAAKGGLSGGDLIQDRRSCFRAGLHMIRGSFQYCSKLPVLDRLSGYTTGFCYANQRESRDRVSKAINWFRKSRPPVVDDDVLAQFHPTPVHPAPSTLSPAFADSRSNFVPH